MTGEVHNTSSWSNRDGTSTSESTQPLRTNLLHPNITCIQTLQTTCSESLLYPAPMPNQVNMTTVSSDSPNQNNHPIKSTAKTNPTQFSSICQHSEEAFVHMHAGDIQTYLQAKTLWQPPIPLSLRLQRLWWIYKRISCIQDMTSQAS